jgi:putative FmdB family regulatory protein
MSIYEYGCKTCNKTFEKLVRNKSEEPQKCHYCQSELIIKKFSTFDAHYKGDGFYKTRKPDKNDLVKMALKSQDRMDFNNE